MPAFATGSRRWPVPPDVAQLVDARAQARTFELMGEVIRSAAENPVPLPDPEGVKENLAAVINATYDQFGTDAQMLANAEDPRADRAKVCTITISVYERILRLPPREASELIRSHDAGAVTLARPIWTGMKLWRKSPGRRGTDRSTTRAGGSTH